MMQKHTGLLTHPQTRSSSSSYQELGGPAIHTCHAPCHQEAEMAGATPQQPRIHGLPTPTFTSELQATKCAIHSLWP